MPIDRTLRHPRAALTLVLLEDRLAPALTNLLAVGGPAGSVMLASAETGSAAATLSAYPGLPAGVGVAVAVADVFAGDGGPEVVTAPGAGGGPHVKVFDPDTRELLAEFMSGDPQSRSGLSVAAGDVLGDSAFEVVTGTGPGTQAVVRVFDTAGNQLAAFAPFGNFTGGVSVAAADVDGDGRAEVVVGAGVGGGPRVAVWDAAAGRALYDFFAFEPEFRGGVTVSAGDADGDGKVDLVVGAGPGGGPRVGVFPGGSTVPSASFFAADPESRGGVSVAAGFARGGKSGGRVDVIASAGGGIRAFDARSGEIVAGWQSGIPAGAVAAFVAPGATDSREIRTVGKLAVRAQAWADAADGSARAEGDEIEIGYAAREFVPTAVVAGGVGYRIPEGKVKDAVLTLRSAELSLVIRKKGERDARVPVFSGTKDFPVSQLLDAGIDFESGPPLTVNLATRKTLTAKEVKDNPAGLLVTVKGIALGPASGDDPVTAQVRLRGSLTLNVPIGPKMLNFQGTLEGKNYLVIALAESAGANSPKQPDIWLTGGSIKLGEVKFEPTPNFTFTLKEVKFALTRGEAGKPSTYSLAAEGSVGLGGPAAALLSGDLDPKNSRFEIGVAFDITFADGFSPKEINAAFTGTFRFANFTLYPIGLGLHWKGGNFSWDIYGSIGVALKAAGSQYVARAELGDAKDPGLVAGEGGLVLKQFKFTLDQKSVEPQDGAPTIGTFQLSKANALAPRKKADAGFLSFLRRVDVAYVAAADGKEGSLGVRLKVGFLGDNVLDGTVAVAIGTAGDLAFKSVALTYTGDLAIGAVHVRQLGLSVDNIATPGPLTLRGTVTVTVGRGLFGTSDGGYTFAATADATWVYGQSFVVTGAASAFGTLERTSDPDTGAETLKFANALGQANFRVEYSAAASNWSVTVDGQILDGLVRFNGRVAASAKPGTNSLLIKISASVGVPDSIPVIGGLRLAGGTLLYLDQESSAENGGRPVKFLAAYGKLSLFGEAGVQYDFVQKKFKSLTSTDIRSLEQSATAADVKTYTSTITLPDGSNPTVPAEPGELNITTTWDDRDARPELQLTLPDKTVIREADFARLGINLVRDGAEFTDAGKGGVRLRVNVSRFARTPGSQYILALTSRRELRSPSNKDGPAFQNEFLYPQPVVFNNETDGVVPTLTGFKIRIFGLAASGTFRADQSPTVTLFAAPANDPTNGVPVGSAPAKYVRRFQDGNQSVFTADIDWDATNLLPTRRVLYTVVNDNVNIPLTTDPNPAPVYTAPVSGQVARLITPSAGSSTPLGADGVRVFVDLNGDGRYDPETEASTVTGPSGYYLLSRAGVGGADGTPGVGFAPGRTYQIVAERPDYAADASAAYPSIRTVALPKDGGASAVNFLFQEAGSVNGRVTAAGAGVPGAVVYSDRNGNGQPDDGEPATRTGTDGSYRLPVTETRAESLKVDLPDGYLAPDALAGARTADTFLGVNSLGNDFAAIQSGFISGVATRRLSSGAVVPLAGAAVKVKYYSQPDAPAVDYQVQADNTGRYSVTTPGSRGKFLAPGRYNLSMDVTPGDKSVASPISINLLPGRAAVADFQTAARPVTNALITGTVTRQDTDGVLIPLAGAVLDVAFEYKSGETGGSVIFDPITTDADGRYVIPGPDRSAPVFAYPGIYTLTLRVPEGDTVILSRVRRLVPAGEVVRVDLRTSIPATPTPVAAPAERGPPLSGVVAADFYGKGSGSPATGSTPVAGATVYLDRNSNGRLDSGEPTSATGPGGYYSFSSAGTVRGSSGAESPVEFVAGQKYQLGLIYDATQYRSQPTWPLGQAPSFTYLGSDLPAALDIQLSSVAVDTTPTATPRRLRASEGLVVGLGGSPASGGSAVVLQSGAAGFSVAAAALPAGRGYRVARGDLDGDGIPEIVVASGPGAAPTVVVFDGKTGVERARFSAFEPAFLGGVSVAVGDLDGDGKAEIVLGAGPGGGPRVRVVGIDGATRADFFAGGESDRGGVAVAAGDFDGDGIAEVVAVSPGADRRPAAWVYSLVAGAPTILTTFGIGDAPPDATSGAGPSVAAGDLDGDGRAELVVGAAPGTLPEVRVFGVTPQGGTELRRFTAYADPVYRGGVGVAVADTGGDGAAEIVAGTGPGGGPLVRTFDGRTSALRSEFFAFDPALRVGVYVG